jgi:hypothetical protein
MNAHKRLPALRRFALAITTLNILGHTVLGFEQSWAHPISALAVAYATELFLEVIDARASRRRPRFLGSPSRFVDFMLSAHISGLAVSMLLYPGQRIMPVIFAAVVAIASKSLIRVPVDPGWRHVFNPSNFGISMTLLAFPSVGIAPPYQFTENLYGAGDWILPGLIVASGSLLNGRLTGRLPLVAGWLGGFMLQATLRALIMGTPVAAGFVPITGVAFVLYTFYMVTDPATTPDAPKRQFAFGSMVAATYGALMAAHIVFGLFFALTIVTSLRWALLWTVALARVRDLERPAARPVAIGALPSGTKP